MDAQTHQRAETVWQIDSGQSAIGFSIKHMKFATVHGRFTAFRGTLRFDLDRPDVATVEVEIDAASIDTGNAKRDEHLRSRDFFDVTRYPAIAFRGTHVEPSDPIRPDRWRVAGNLTMHGITLPVELDVQRSGSDPVFWDVEAASFTATTRISRRQFGIGLDLLLDSGGLVIGDDVKIAIQVQVIESSAGTR